jgi:glycerophosphoryl diester phosphodiesterase
MACSWRRGVRQRPLVIGHRGYKARYPENTLLSFREAFAAGADGVECDVQKTGDGRYAIIHDATLGRVAGSGLAVGESSLRRLKELDVGRAEKIPELAELLEAIPPARLLDLELKTDTLSVRDCRRIRGILSAAIAPRRVMISSFEPRLLFPFRRSGFTLGLLIGSQTASHGAARLALLLGRLRPSFLNVPLQAVDILGKRTARLLALALCIAGISLLLWTVNGEREIEKSRGLACALVTDDLAGTLASIAQWVK